jgi:hypothetical protein
MADIDFEPDIEAARLPKGPDCSVCRLLADPDRPRLATWLRRMIDANENYNAVSRALRGGPAGDGVGGVEIAGQTIGRHVREHGR